MTSTPPAAPGNGTQDTGPRVSGEQMRDLSRLRRSIADRKVAGVAGGLGRHLDIDPTLLRVAFVALAFFGGAGILLYGAACLLVPEDGRDEAAIASSPSTRTTVLVVVAAVAALLAIGDGWGGFGFGWPLLVVGLVVALVLVNKDRRTHSRRAQAPTDPIRADAPASDRLPPHTEPLPWEMPEPVTPTPRRGPLLFWPTLAIIALALGGLGIYDAAGGSVVAAAYPALALAVVGVVLTVGAWFGRTGGLVFIGILAAVALAVSSVVPRLAAGSVEEAPTSASGVDPEYSLAAGTIDLDLSNVEDVEELDGRTIDVDSTVGRIVVTVPDDVEVDVNAEVSGAGDVVLFGHRTDGADLSVSRTTGHDAGPVLDIDIALTFGHVDVRNP